MIDLKEIACTKISLHHTVKGSFFYDVNLSSTPYFWRITVVEGARLGTGGAWEN